MNDDPRDNLLKCSKNRLRDDDDEAVLNSYYEGMREIKRFGKNTSILIQSLRVVCF